MLLFLPSILWLGDVFFVVFGNDLGFSFGQGSFRGDFRGLFSFGLTFWLGFSLGLVGLIARNHVDSVCLYGLGFVLGLGLGLLLEKTYFACPCLGTSFDQDTTSRSSWFRAMMPAKHVPNITSYKGKERCTSPSMCFIRLLLYPK